jgi:hypothetical protein
MRVLLIEDHSATAQSIELMLKSESFNVYRTDLGEEGVDLGKLYDYEREKERAQQDATLAAMRADLAAGADLDIVAKRALSAGIKRTAVAEFLGLSRPQVYKLAGLGRVLPSWTRERVKLLACNGPRQ